MSARRSLTVLLLLCLLPVRFSAAQTAVSATTVKAVFLYRFAGYVQWPNSSSGPFTIAVIGAPDVAAQLAQLLPDHPIQGRRAQVRAIDRVSELRDAQILYIGPDYHGNLRSLIAPLAGRPVLVVTDAPDGLSAGGTVNFLIEQQHVRFEVSTAAARRAGLRISSDLLAVAVRVQTGLLLPLPAGYPGATPAFHADVRPIWTNTVDVFAQTGHTSARIGRAGSYWLRFLLTTASRACPAAGTSCRRA